MADPVDKCDRAAGGLVGLANVPAQPATTGGGAVDCLAGEGAARLAWAGDAGVAGE